MEGGGVMSRMEQIYMYLLCMLGFIACCVMLHKVERGEVPVIERVEE